MYIYIYIYSCTQVWWKDAISLLQKVWEQDIFHWEGCQAFPLYTSLSLSSLLSTLFLCCSTPACTSLCFHSLSHFNASLSLCFCLLAGSGDVWDTVNPHCWLQAVRTPQFIKVSGAGTLNHAGSKAWEPVSKLALSALHQIPPSE